MKEEERKRVAQILKERKMNRRVGWRKNVKGCLRDKDD